MTAIFSFLPLTTNLYTLDCKRWYACWRDIRIASASILLQNTTKYSLQNKFYFLITIHSFFRSIIPPNKIEVVMGAELCDSRNLDDSDSIASVCQELKTEEHGVIGKASQLEDELDEYKLELLNYQANVIHLRMGILQAMLRLQDQRTRNQNQESSLSQVSDETTQISSEWETDSTESSSETETTSIIPCSPGRHLSPRKSSFLKRKSSSDPSTPPRRVHFHISTEILSLQCPAA